MVDIVLGETYENHTINPASENLKIVDPLLKSVIAKVVFTEKPDEHFS